MILIKSINLIQMNLKVVSLIQSKKVVCFFNLRNLKILSSISYKDNKNNQIKDLSSLKSRNNGSKISNNLNYQSSQNHFSNNKNFSYLAEFEKITHSFTFGNLNLSFLYTF